MATLANQKSSGGPADIGRRAQTFDYAVDTLANLATIPVIQFGSFSGLGIINPTGSGISTLQIYVGDDADGTFVPLKDSSDSDVTIAVSEGESKEFGELPIVWTLVTLAGDAAATAKVQHKG